MKKLITILLENIPKNFNEADAKTLLLDIYEKEYDNLSQEDQEILKENMEKLGL